MIVYRNENDRNSSGDQEEGEKRIHRHRKAPGHRKNENMFQNPHGLKNEADVPADYGKRLEPFPFVNFLPNGKYLPEMVIVAFNVGNEITVNYGNQIKSTLCENKECDTVPGGQWNVPKHKPTFLKIQ